MWELRNIQAVLKRHFQSVIDQVQEQEAPILLKEEFNFKSDDDRDDFSDTDSDQALKNN